MSYIAVMNWDGSNRVTKVSPEFATLAEAQALAAQGGTLPGTNGAAYAVLHPGGGSTDWLCDPAAKTLIISSLLAPVKAKKIDDVKALFAVKVSAGKLHNAKTYQLDAAARENFLGVAAMFGMSALNPHGGTWRDLDNTEVPLNDVEMRALLAAVFVYLRDLRRALTTHIAAIRALATVADVNAYNINAGWPANT